MEKVVSEPEKKWKKLVCIEYPGVVNNIDKMLVTLGGLDKISEIYGEGTRRLELRFRPDDLHCKPACADLHNTTALAVRVIKRVKKKKDYWFRKEGAKESRSEGNVISVTRRRRMHYTVFRSFQDDVCPTQPCSDLRKVVSKKFDAHIVDSVKAEFEKRPIWSKSAIICRLGYSDNQLKIILPSLAYYYNLGPWGKLWVRFGFDPKKDPNAWMYQSFDFRMRQAGGMKYKVEAKRSYSNCTLPYKTGNPCKKKISVIQSDLLGEEADEKKEPDSPDKKTITKDIYLFRPGMIPPYRQMFYQYCDVHVPELQKLLETSILTSANKVCSQTNGWLPAGVEAKCRNILSDLIEKTIVERAAKGQDLKDELRSNSEDEDSPENSSEDDHET